MKQSHRRVPVYTVDEHNEAIHFWHKARLDAGLKTPLDLFHIDAHDDMGRPLSFRTSLHAPRLSADCGPDYYRDFARSELHNGNFIIPAVLAGMVRNVYFIYPKWRKFKRKTKRWNVASVFGEGKILKYGMKAAENMEEKARKVLPDLTRYSFITTDVDGIPRNKGVILDIDLDYFACRDSILNEFRYELAITPEQYRNRDAILTDKTLLFAALTFEFSQRDDGYFVRVSHKLGKDVSHRPSREEILSEIAILVDTLRSRRIKPLVVTIAKSCISGYCPPEYVGMIETALSERLLPFLDSW